MHVIFKQFCWLHGSEIMLKCHGFNKACARLIYCQQSDLKLKTSVGCTQNINIADTPIYHVNMT